MWSIVYHHCESRYSLRLMIYSLFARYTRKKRMRYTLKRDDMPLLSQWINKKGTFGRQKFLFCWSRRRDSNPRPLRPERNALPAALRLDFSIFWRLSYLLKKICFTIFKIIYKTPNPNAVIPSKINIAINHSGILAYLLNLFSVSGQTCGQATYFEHFLEKCTARIVSVVKGFRGSNKSTKESPCGCPERNALPAALRLDLSIRRKSATLNKRNHYNKYTVTCQFFFCPFTNIFSQTLSPFHLCEKLQLIPIFSFLFSLVVL